MTALLLFEEIFLNRPRGRIFQLAKVIDEKCLHQIRTTGNQGLCNLNHVVEKLQQLRVLVVQCSNPPQTEGKLWEGDWMFEGEPTSTL